MIVKGELKQAQIEGISTAEEATAKHARGMLYFNYETFEMLVSDGAVFKRFSALKPSASIGDIKASVLTELDLQAELDSTWVLADGRNVAGSDYATLTGQTNIPDLRGMFLRGRNNGRSDGWQNPDGELNLGQLQNDDFKIHSHNASGSFQARSGPGGIGYYGLAENSSAPGASVGVSVFVDANGGNESRPRNVTVNYFIKINR